MKSNQAYMDRELEILSQYQEPFPPTPEPSVIEVMERDREIYRAYEYFEEFRKMGMKKKMRGMAKFILWKFGVDLNNK